MDDNLGRMKRIAFGLIHSLLIILIGISAAVTINIAISDPPTIYPICLNYSPFNPDDAIIIQMDHSEQPCVLNGY